jgi:hypothetical protein
MSTVLDQELPPPPADALPVGASNPQWPIAQPTTSAEPPKRRSGGHIAAIVVGIVMILPSLGALFGGTALLVARSAAADDGFFDVTLDRIESDGVAVTSIDLWDTADDPDEPVVLDWLDVEVRLAVEGAGPTDEVFVGIARTDDVLDYLAGTEYSEAVEFDGREPRYLEMAGTGSIEAPGSIDIWDASASGSDEQVLTWEARSGDWSVVVMNADGSRDVAADVEVGVRSDALTTIAIVMLVLGGIGVIVSTILIVIGVRGRR